MASDEGSTRPAPIPAMLVRYMKRRDLGVVELGGLTGRDHSAISQILAGDSVGLKSWRRERPLLFRIAEALQIPDKELRKAIADHFQLQAADSLLAEMKASKRSKRASKTWLTQTAREQRELALAVGL